MSVQDGGRIDEVEQQLVRRARAGDAEAYGELTRRHRPAALRVAAVVLGTAEGADDVVQQALERAWRGIDRFDPGRSFRPWLLRIAANLARNDRRSRGRRARLALRTAVRPEDSAETRTPEEVVVSEDERRLVVEALNRLSAADRLVIALRHFERLPEAQMAEVLGCRPGTVKSRLARATARLRSELTRGRAPDGAAGGGPAVRPEGDAGPGESAGVPGRAALGPEAALEDDAAPTVSDREGRRD